MLQAEKTDKQTNKRYQTHNLFGGGNNVFEKKIVRNITA